MMGTALLRFSYATILLGSAAFVTISPYGAWPLPVLSEQAAAIAQTVETATAAAVPEAGCKPGPCPVEVVVPVVLPMSPAATVVEIPSAASVSVQQAKAVAQAPAKSIGHLDKAPAIAPEAEHAAVSSTPPVKAAVEPSAQSAPEHAVGHAKPKEQRPRQGVEKVSAEKARTPKPLVDSDWAIRQVFNRGG